MLIYVFTFSIALRWAPPAHSYGESTSGVLQRISDALYPCDADSKTVR